MTDQETDTDPDVETALRAGLALYHDGSYHAAHEPWEEAWLPLEVDTDDERLLHGLVQVTAAVYHARSHNWSGATGLATSAREYLLAVDRGHRDVDVAPAIDYCRRLAADPETIERVAPPPIRHGGSVVRPADLAFEATLLAAVALAEGDTELTIDPELVEDAIELARAERGTGRSRHAALLFDLVRDSRHRPLIASRLADHVERDRTRRTDVDGLFDEE